MRGCSTLLLLGARQISKTLLHQRGVVLVLRLEIAVLLELLAELVLDRSHIFVYTYSTNGWKMYTPVATPTIAATNGALILLDILQ